MSHGWNSNDPHVKKLLAWTREKYLNGEALSPEELVRWDARHGRNVFNWNDASAARDQRVHQARMFLNRFSGMINGNRVRGWINVSPGDDAEESGQVRAYYPAPVVIEDKNLRQRTISNVTQRLETQARTLQFLELTRKEQRAILRRIETAMLAGDLVPA